MMKLQLGLVLGATCLITGCSPPDQNMAVAPGPQAKIQAQAVPVPNADMADTFKDCSWGEVKGPELSIYAFTCPPERTSARLVADPSLPGFVLESVDDTGKKITAPAIRVFTKGKDATLSSIGAQVRQLSPDAPGGDCQFKQWTGEDADSIGFSGRKLFSWEPNGPAKLAWEDFNSPSDSPSTAPPPPPPCGIAGPQMIGAIVFEEVIGDPTKVAMITLGSEISIFASQTLRTVAN